MEIQFLFWSTNIQTKEMLRMQITHVKNYHLQDRPQPWKGKKQLLLPHLHACAKIQTILHYSNNKSHRPQPRELSENINTIYIFLESVLSHSLHFFFFFYFVCVLTKSRIECQLSRAGITDSCWALNSGSLLFTFVFWDMSQVWSSELPQAP